MDIARLLLNDPEWDPSDLTREKDFSYSMPGIGRFRVHIFTQRGSLGIVIRVIPYEVRGFDSLNLPRVLADIADGLGIHRNEAIKYVQSLLNDGSIQRRQRLYETFYEAVGPR